MGMAKTNKNDTLQESGLFGLVHSNRKPEDHWSKNRFNSSFPAAVAAYMLENDIPAIYNRLELVDGELTVISSEISMSDVFNTKVRSAQDLAFNFETRFQPYAKYSTTQIDIIDLVVKDLKGAFLSPLEVKLTVLPTSATAEYTEDKWGCEIVVRSATTSYCALGMFDSVKQDKDQVRDIFEDACADIQSWTNEFEMANKTEPLVRSVNEFQQQYLAKQKPILMQTIWKTQGQTPLLAEQAFDILIWSDFAFTRLFLDSKLPAKNNNVKLKMSRPMRASARLARCIWELSKSGKIRLAEIYREMAFGTQTDKEFAVNGDVWRKYVTSDRVPQLRLSKDSLNEIIKPGFVERLKPERRFDQTLKFTYLREGR